MLGYPARSALTVWARLCGVVASLGLLAVGMFTQLPAASAASPADSCLAAGQVYLVVVKDSGGVMYRGCVGNPSSGYAALSSSGLGYTLAPPPRGYVCTIGGYPTCPANFEGQYWSYWRAAPGGGYSYSTVGAQGGVKPGHIYGWCHTSVGGQGAQQAACRAQLTAALNPATASATAAKPTAKPTTAQPTTAKPTAATPSTAKPATAKPTTAKPTAARPTSRKKATPATVAPTSAATATPAQVTPTGGKPGSASTGPAQTATTAPVKGTGSATPSGAPATASPKASPTGSANQAPRSATQASPSGAVDRGSDQAEGPVTTGTTEAGSSSGSATGVLVTGGVVLAAAALTGGGLLWRRRRQ